MLKRVGCWISFFALVLTLLPAPPGVAAPKPAVAAASAVLMDAYSGKILYAKNPHARMAPASVTKVMTLLLAVEAIARGKASWKDRVVASEAAWEMGGSEIWLEPGEEMSLRELLIAIAVGSANDACVAVAEHLAGSEEAFVALMNAKARSLGLRDTHFVNSHGLPAKGHYTSAYDMARICRAALDFPELLELTSIKHYYKLRRGKTRLDNTNKLLWWYPGTDGFKTGWTNEAQYCLASTVKRRGLRLICCVFGVPDAGGHFRESVKLYNWGFANYRFEELFPQGKVLARLKVGRGEKEEVPAVAARAGGVLLERGEEAEVTTRLRLPPSVTAPVAEVAPLGAVEVLVNGKVRERIPLVAGEEVAEAGLGRQLRRSLRYFFS